MVACDAPLATRYPPIQLYERVSPDPAVWDALIAAEALVNPRVRDEAGEIQLVPTTERVSGPGASYVMAAFTHRNPLGSRFSDGSYGVYYCAQDRATALAETAFHVARFARDAADEPRYEDLRVLVARLMSGFTTSPEWIRHRARRCCIRTPMRSQPWGRALREANSRGIHYPSVRHPGGRCLAVFRPKSVGLPRVASHVQLHWDGTAVRRWFDYGTNLLTDLA